MFWETGIVTKYIGEKIHNYNIVNGEIEIKMGEIYRKEWSTIDIFHHSVTCT